MFPIFGAFAVLLDADPFSSLFGGNNSIIYKTIRFLLMQLMTMEIGKCGSFGLTISYAIVYLVSTWLYRLNQSINKLTEGSALHTAIIKFKKQKPIELKRRLNVYRIFYVFWKYVNDELATYISATFIFFGCLVIIVCNYMSLKLYGKIAFYMYMLGPFNLSFAIPIALTLLPAGTYLQEGSSKYLGKLRICITYNLKRSVRELRSLRPMASSIAVFGIADKEWKGTVLKAIVNHTINALLLF